MSKIIEFPKPRCNGAYSLSTRDSIWCPFHKTSEPHVQCEFDGGPLGATGPTGSFEPPKSA